MYKRLLAGIFAVCLLVGNAATVSAAEPDSAENAFASEEDSDEYRKKVFNTVFFSMIKSSCIILMLIWMAPYISFLLFKTDKYKIAIMISLASVAISMWSMPFSLNLRMKNLMKRYSAVLVLSSMSMLSLNILFVVFLEFGYVSLIFSTFLVNMLQIVLFWRLSDVHVGYRYLDKALLYKMVKYATPLVPLTVLNWLLSLSDRYILNYMHGQEVVGIYGIASRFVSILNIVTNSLFISYTTFAFANKSNENAKELYSRILDAVYFLIVIMAWVVSIFGKEIVYLMTSEEYMEAYTILPSLFFGQLCYAVNTIVGYGIGFAKKTEFFLFSTGIGAIVNVILNCMLIPNWGLQAAAATTFAGYFIVMMSNYCFAQKVYPCAFRIKKILLTLLGLYFLSIAVMHCIILVRMIIFGFGIVLLIFFYQDIAGNIFHIMIKRINLIKRR